jgi:hypothetical protein
VFVLGCFLAGAAGHLSAADLAGVHSVYVMPMARGFDQFLANRLTNDHVVQVVVDAKLADAILTDKLGDALADKLDEISPAGAASATAANSDKTKDADEAKKQRDSQTRLDNPASISALGRSKGTLFLVDAKTRQVVWSTFQVPKNGEAAQLDRTATDIVTRLKRDLKR